MTDLSDQRLDALHASDTITNFCPNGHSVRDTATFCPSCGQGILRTYTPPPVTWPEPAPLADPTWPYAAQHQGPTDQLAQYSQFGAPPPTTYLPYPQPGPARDHHKGALAIIGVVLVAVATVTFGILNSGGSSGGGSSTTTSDFNDPAVLAPDIMNTINTKAADPSNPGYMPGVSVTDETCIRKAEHVFTCIATWNDGTNTTQEATVSADGQTWITSSR